MTRRIDSSRIERLQLPDMALTRQLPERHGTALGQGTIATTDPRFGGPSST